MKKSISLIVLILVLMGCTALNQRVQNEKPSVEVRRNEETTKQEQTPEIEYIETDELDNIEEAKIWYDKGIKALEVKDYDKAILYFKTSAVKNLIDPKGNFGLGMVYFKLEQLDDSKKAFNRALAVEPNMPWAHYYLGDIYYKKGMVEKSASEYEKCIELDPNNVDAYYYLGWLLHYTGEYYAAYLRFKSATDLNPSYKDVVDEEYWFNLGVGSNDTEEKIRYYKQALVINDSIPEAHFNLGIIYHEGGLYDKAALEFYKAAEVNPNYAWLKDPFEWFNKGVNAENFNGKIKYYKQAIAINPQFASAYYNLGVLYGKKDMIDEAMEKYKKTIEISPDHADAYLNLGYLYSEKRLYGLAADYYYQAGLLYLKQGDREGAVTAYNNLQAIPAKELEQALFEKLYPELKQKKGDSSK